MCHGIDRSLEKMPLLEHGISCAYHEISWFHESVNVWWFHFLAVFFFLARHSFSSIEQRKRKCELEKCNVTMYRMHSKQFWNGEGHCYVLLIATINELYDWRWMDEVEKRKREEESERERSQKENEKENVKVVRNLKYLEKNTERNWCDAPAAYCFKLKYVSQCWHSINRSIKLWNIHLF